MWSDMDIYRALVRLQAKLGEVRAEIAWGDPEEAHARLFAAQSDLVSLIGDLEEERGFVYAGPPQPAPKPC
jgi:hypothetical protein